MQRILAIFRKDARRLWPQIAAWIGLMALTALLDPTYTSHRLAAYDVLPSLALPACWLLVIAAIHQEPLSGHRQYWLTRPFSWRELLASKALFIAAFVNLPLLVYHAGVCAALGIPISDHLAALLWRQVFFTIFYILPAAVLAAITQNLGQVVMTALAGVVYIWLSGLAVLSLARYRMMMYQGLDGPMRGPAAGIFAAGAIAILVFQYWSRRPAGARALTAAVIATGFAVTVFGPQVWGSDGGRDSGATLTLGQGSGGRSPMRSIGRPGTATLDIPVRLDGIPPGTVLEQKRMTVEIAVPGRRDLPGTGDAGFHDLASGRGWLSVLIDRRLLEATESKPVALSGTLSFQRFGRSQRIPFQRGRRSVIPGIGVCGDTSDSDGALSFFCYTPGPRRALMLGNFGSRVNWIIPQGSVQRSIPTASGFQPVMSFVSQVSYRGWDQAGNVSFLALDMLPPVRIPFEFAGLHLADYVVR